MDDNKDVGALKELFTRINEKYNFARTISGALIVSFLIFLVDYFDFPSSLIKDYGTKPIIIGSVLFILCIIIYSIQYNIFAVIRMNTVTWLDNFIIFSIFFSIAYLLEVYLIDALYLYKALLLIALICGICLLAYRFFLLIEKNKKIETASQNMDIIKLYRNELPSRPETSVLFFDDYPSSQDLLDRELIMQWLYNAIRYAAPMKSSFIVGVSGEWGSGKTTILDLVTKRIKKEKLNDIIIDCFNPWIYSDEQSLLLNMMETIIKHTGYNYSVISTRKLGSKIINQICQHDKTGLLNLFLNNMDVDINQLKKDISKCLDASNKKIVFIVDNLDRLEDKNILSILSFLCNIMNIDQIIYVLSYDKKQIIDVLIRNNYDPSFLDKIVNMEIAVPDFTDERKAKIVFQCLSNYIKYHGANIEIAENSALISTLCTYIKNLRLFTIFLNSIMAKIVDTKDYLNLIDLIGIEIIHMFNPNLYNTIYKNPQFFIGEDQTIFDSMHLSRIVQGKEKWKTDQTKFFKDIFDIEENKHAKNLVEYLFPIVAQSEFSLFSRTKKRLDGRKICSGKYFSLYFTLSSNHHLEIDRYAKSVVDQAENSDTEDTVIIKDIEQSFSDFPEQLQGELLRNIQLRFDKLSNAAALRLSVAVYNNATKWSSDVISILSTKSTAAAIISEFLKRQPESQIHVFAKVFEEDYANIFFIDTILYYYRGKDNSGSDNNYDVLHTEHKLLGKQIIRNRINLYDNKYYSKSNIWGLVHVYSDQPDIINEYIRSNVTPDHVYRLIFDCISEGNSSSESEKYLFNISRESLNKLTSIETIDGLLVNKQPTTESEIIVKTIYTNFRNRTNGKDGTSSIDSDYTSAEQIVFDL